MAATTRRLSILEEANKANGSNNGNIISAGIAYLEQAEAENFSPVEMRHGRWPVARSSSRRDEMPSRKCHLRRRASGAYLSIVTSAGMGRAVELMSLAYRARQQKNFLRENE